MQRLAKVTLIASVLLLAAAFGSVSHHESVSIFGVTQSVLRSQASLAGASEDISFFEGYYIRNYDVTMKVNTDNSYDIVETLDVVFDLSASKHGIYRTIPTRSSSGYNAKVKNVKVTGAPFKIEDTGNGKLLKIGDPDTYASENQTYVITYNYFVGDQLLDGYEEFIYNIIGTEWDTAIGAATYSVEMPAPFDEKYLNVYSGAHGATTNPLSEYSVRGKTILGKSTDVLMPGRGISISLYLNEGYFSTMKKRTDLDALMLWVAPLLGVVLVLLVVAAWFKWRRNNRIFPSVQFYPPDELTSADIGYVIDGQSQPEEITSLIFYWASKGYLTISEVEKKSLLGKKTTFSLTKIKDISSKAKVYEKTMFNDMFELGSDGVVTEADLKDKFYECLNAAKSGVKASFDDVKGNELKAESDSAFTFLAWGSSVVILMLAQFLNTGIAGVSDFGFYGWLGAAFVTALFITGMFFTCLRPFVDKAFRTTFFGYIGYVWVWVVGSLIFSIAFGVTGTSPPALMLGFVVSSVACAWLAATEYKRTPMADDLMGRILGFKQFLKVAEKDKLEMLIDENPTYFFDTLPYALVLDVTDAWSKKFEGIEMSQPSWYVTNQPRPFAPVLFMSGMNRSLNSINSVALSKPASAGSSAGGGGFSGGGFGGGGGGSW